MKLADRMKVYESQTTSQTLIPRLPIMVRLDGKKFSTFTKGLKRPFDERFSKLMIETTKFMVKETGANCGYTGSDEITLVFYNNSNNQSEMFYGGKIYKIESDLAALCSVFFFSKLKEYLPEKEGIITRFDARTWNVPNFNEVANSFLEREISVTKNSISMVAETLYSHDDLEGKNQSDRQEMLFQKGINWNDFPSYFKRGTYIQKKIKKGKLDIEDIENLPEKHEARRNPNMEIKRSVIVELDLPILTSIENKVDVLINGKNFILKEI